MFLILILVVLFLCLGGGYYGHRSGWYGRRGMSGDMNAPGYTGGGGMGILGIVLVVVVLLVLFGAIGGGFYTGGYGYYGHSTTLVR